MKYKIVFFPNTLKGKISQKLRENLESQGWEEVQDSEAEYIFIVGGDGSFFHFAKEYASQDKRLVGIQAGKTAFALDFKLDGNFDDLLNQEWTNISLLQVRVGDSLLFAANDVYIVGRLFLEGEVSLNGTFLETFRGSGVLFSTQCGSTGLNRSLGGPILVNEGMWVFSKMAPCNTSRNQTSPTPLVLDEKNDVEIAFPRKNMFYLYIDGRKVSSCDQKKLHISMIKGKAKVLKIKIEDYVNKINSIFLS